MAKYNNQKAKILYLQQMLLNTKKGNPLSMQQILDQLETKDIHAERKSIYDDMDVLRAFGMDIEYSRERPNGYYLAGEHSVSGGLETVSVSAKEQRVESVEKQEMPNPDAWKTFLPDADSEKQMKLICSAKGVNAVTRYFGDFCQVKEKENGEYQVTAPLLETEEFFGWLTAMYRHVRLVKPKKTTQSYRDFLKTISKSYKEK